MMSNQATSILDRQTVGNRQRCRPSIETLRAQHRNEKKLNRLLYQ